MCAVLQPRLTKKDFSTLEVHREALNTPYFLDYLVCMLVLLYHRAQQQKQQTIFCRSLYFRYMCDGGADGGADDGRYSDDSDD